MDDLRKIQTNGKETTDKDKKWYRVYVNKDLKKKCQQAKYECLNKKCPEKETL